jgi:hypothetical protein
MSAKLRRSMTMWVWWIAEMDRPLPRRPRQGWRALNARNSSMWVQVNCGTDTTSGRTSASQCVNPVSASTRTATVLGSSTVSTVDR